MSIPLYGAMDVVKFCILTFDLLHFLQMPGTIMAMGRLNRPSIMVYGGTIKVRAKLVVVVCLG